VYIYIYICFDFAKTLSIEGRNARMPKRKKPLKYKGFFENTPLESRKKGRRERDMIVIGERHDSDRIVIAE